MCWVESLQERVGFPPLTADHYVLARLVPEVVSKGRGIPGCLPVTLDRERGSIDQNEPTCMENGGSMCIHVRLCTHMYVLLHTNLTKIIIRTQ